MKALFLFRAGGCGSQRFSMQRAHPYRSSYVTQLHLKAGGGLPLPDDPSGVESVNQTCLYPARI
ncbi:hypothetical protein CPSG_02350 [Coccidioides posadasii str. Silveira]|uniref:Uncharacterized protein n=1 Tax=Coccidioides posadasii (strain RMSCC 757 / Silveira) TaxID=443226 RepID=E9CZ63_COCPS|nr:hypothetical protein CPSG_02350 [Coccidioides posadasii str. Silveira]